MVEKNAGLDLFLNEDAILQALNAERAADVLAEANVSQPAAADEAPAQTA